MKLGRRNFLIKFFFGVLGIFFLDAFWFERYIIDWNQYDLFDGKSAKLKCIQLTDLHLKTVRSFHQAIARRINREQPDLLFITGDSINYSSKLPVLDEFLDLIDPSIQKIAIMGNKEYWGRINTEALGLVYKKHNGHLLINENMMLGPEKGNFQVIGVDDFIGGNADFRIAANNIKAGSEVIVLNHCPYYRDIIDDINKELRLNIKLVLCGHTHGGQITFLGKVFFKPDGSGRYLKGWYQSEQSKMYVSKGVGTSIIPLRLGSRAEATIFYV